MSIMPAGNFVRKMRCDRCNRRHRGQGNWNLVFKAGVVIGALCPTCQTPEENAEAEVNASTTAYSRDAFGRTIGTPKTGGA